MDKPASLTIERGLAILPSLETDPEWERKHDAGLLRPGILGMVGSLRTVPTREKMTIEEARWVVWYHENVGSLRCLADEVVGDSNQCYGVLLEEAAKERIAEEIPKDPGT